MDIHKDVTVLPLFARRIEEAQIARADHLREVEKLDILLGRLQSEFNEMTNRTALIASMPNEILSAIFEAGCSLPQSQPSKPSFEILVSQVTRHWRSVAINTPGLWTQITISNRKKNLYMVDVYSTRSMNLPLDVRVDIKTGSPPTSAILQTIIPHISRWRHLWIQCNRPRRHLSSIFRSLHAATSPLLEFVQISLKEMDDEDSDDGEEEVYGVEDDADDEYINGATREILTGGAASLKTVRLQDIALHSCMPPLSVVTTLHLHYRSSELSLPYTTMCTIFNKLPALTHLVLHGCFVNDIELVTGSTSTITFPALSSLHILSSAGSSACIPILAIVSAPLLERLFLEDVDDDDMEAVLQSPGWSTTSPRYSRLRYLALIQSQLFKPTTWRHVAQSFATVTNLTVLNTNRTAFHEVLLQAIEINSNYSYPPSSTDIPWPALKMLSWDTVGLADVSSLCLTLSARVAMGRPLGKLRILKPAIPVKYIPQDALVRLQQYTEVTEYELKRWPMCNLSAWYDGD